MLTASCCAAIARILTLPIDDRLKRLLTLRRDQLGGEFAGCVSFLVIQPLDPPSWVEAALGWNLLQNAGNGTWPDDPDYTPSFDLIEDHDCCFELTFELADFTQVILVEKALGVHRDFLEFCARYAAQHA